LKQLQKTGSVPQYGSFKYTAAELHRKGVLISIADHTPKQ
jgi:Ras GTPase-activating-like protein IQGAP2/3